MSRVIAIFNQKGGVGKTTTAVNLSAYLSFFGKRVLLIDLDPQYNATVGFGILHSHGETIYHTLIGEAPVRSVIKKTHLSSLDIIPASPDLSGALVELIEIPEREYLLRRVVDEVRRDYDFIFIDLGPSVNLLTINGLMAADEVIVPVQCEYYSLEGLSQLLETIELIKNNLGHPIKIAGALLTMYDKRERLSRDVAKEIRFRFPYKVFDVEIPRSVSLAEAPSFKKPIMFYAPQSPGASAYERLAREILSEAPIGAREGNSPDSVLHSVPDISRKSFFEETPKNVSKDIYIFGEKSGGEEKSVPEVSQIIETPEEELIDEIFKPQEEEFGDEPEPLVFIFHAEE